MAFQSQQPVSISSWSLSTCSPARCTPHSPSQLTMLQMLLYHSLQSGDSMHNVLVIDHDPKFTSQLFHKFTKAIGSVLILGTAYHKNTGGSVKWTNSVLGDTLRGLANSGRDNWDKWVLYSCFAINNTP